MKKILVGFIAFLLIFSLPINYVPLITTTANETDLMNQGEIHSDEGEKKEAEKEIKKETETTEDDENAEINDTEKASNGKDAQRKDDKTNSDDMEKKSNETVEAAKTAGRQGDNEKSKNKEYGNQPIKEQVSESLTLSSSSDYKFGVIGDDLVSLEGYNGSSKELVLPSYYYGLVKFIGFRTDNAFANLQLTNVILPDSITGIGKGAFSNNKLTNIIIPASAWLIEDSAFSSNHLTSVVIHGKDVFINENAFADNQSNPADLTIIGYEQTNVQDYANRKGYTFQNIIDSGHLEYTWKDNGNGTATITKYIGTDTDIVIPNTLGGLTVTEIGNSAFYNNNLTNVVIPENVTKIGYDAFAFNNLASVVIPQSVTSIEKATFYNNNLTNVVIPKNVTKIGYDAFAFNNLASVVIPQSVTSIERAAFYNNNLTRVVIPESVTTIGSAAFAGNNLAHVIIYNSSTDIVGSAFDYNQTNSTDLTIYGYTPSTAKDIAELRNYKFVNAAGSVSFSPNGNSNWGQSHATKVDVSGYDENQALEYAWTMNSSTPTSGWAPLTNSDTLSTPEKSGEYYLHIKGVGLFGNTFNFRSDVFKVDNTKPSLTITPSTTNPTHDDVTLTVKGSDAVSGVKRIQDPDGNWHDEDQIRYTVKDNGTYAFIVEDFAGNQTIESIEINNIDKTISFEIPAISSMSDITLSSEPTTHTTDVSPIIVKDWRDGTNDWRLDVSAGRLKMANSDYELPVGTIKLKPLLEISRVEGTGSVPAILITEKTPLDNGEVTIAETNNSRGDFDFIFPEAALEFLIDPTTIKVNNPNGTTYETTITWALITAP